MSIVVIFKMDNDNDDEIVGQINNVLQFLLVRA